MCRKVVVNQIRKPQMTKKQQDFHKSLIKSLHISRKYKEYFKDNKDEYVELLQLHFGVDSSKELSIDQLIILVDYMNFKNVNLPLHRPNADALCTQAQLSTMRGLWKTCARDPRDETLVTFVNIQRHSEYELLHLVSKFDAQKIIPVLKSMNK